MTIIDTPGAELSPEAENGALAREIAWTVADLAAAKVPTVSVLLGEGAGGGALALLPARRTVALADAWLAPLPPEGASVLVHADLEHAPELARRQQISATALRASGRVHAVVPTRTGDSPAEVARAVAAEVRHQLSELGID